MAGTRNIFCLLTLIVICAGEWNEVKPGTCPPARCPTCKPRTDCAKWCTKDSECLEDKKCCPEGKGKVCKPPKEVTPGVCPPVSKPPKKSCDDECTSDSECAPDYKCCFSEEGKSKCVLVKPGVCPLTIFCIQGSHSLCSSDGGCPGTDKCCDYRCGKDCLPAVHSLDITDE